MRRVDCEKKLGASRHSSFDAVSRKNEGVNHTDMFEIASRDWVIDLNILTDRSMYARPTKLVFERRRIDPNALKSEFNEGDKYDGSELLDRGTWRRLGKADEVIDEYLLKSWKENKATGSRKLDDLRRKALRDCKHLRITVMTHKIYILYTATMSLSPWGSSFCMPLR